MKPQQKKMIVNNKKNLSIWPKSVTIRVLTVSVIIMSIRFKCELIHVQQNVS